MFPSAYFSRPYFDFRYFPESITNFGALRIASQDVFVPGAVAQTAFSLGTIQDASGTTGVVTQDAS